MRSRSAQLRLAPLGADVAGVGVTASLATGAPKRGEHACHVATRTRRGTAAYSLTFAKGARDRAGEEALASRLLVQALADASDVAADLTSAHLLSHAGDDEASAPVPEHIERSNAPIGDALGALLARDAAVRVLQLRGGCAVGAVGAAAPRVLLPGSFNPLHAGHAALLAAACAACGAGARGGFELSVTNADKGVLPRAEIERRAAQFTPATPPLVLSDAPLFVQKAALMPGTTFVVGVDTALRIVMPKYYAGGDEAAMRAVLQEILDAGCSFLVAGRLIDGAFVEPTAVTAPPGMEGVSCGALSSCVACLLLTRARACLGLFRSLPAFRQDISSSELRARAAAGVAA
jgi:hypothetical protein